MNAVSSSVVFLAPNSRMVCASHAATVNMPFPAKSKNSAGILGPTLISSDDIVCKVCACAIPRGSQFAWAEPYQPAGGWRRSGARTRSNGPSMVQPSAPAPAPIQPAPAAPAPVPAAIQPAPASMDLDLIIRIATKAAKEAADSAVNGILGRVDAIGDDVSEIVERVIAVEMRPSDAPRVIHVATYVPNGVDGPEPATALGPVHFQFPELVETAKEAADSGMGVWVWGNPGWGKTFHFALLAQALRREFRMQGSIRTPEADLIGYFQPGTDRLVRPAFRDSLEFGGVHLCDEIDASADPSVPLTINAALSFSKAPFPDGMIARHPDFLFCAAANTDGSGATADFNGRVKFDAAFLDRFLKIEWKEDPALESALYPTAARYVQELRAKAKAKGIRTFITMRASAKVAAKMARGKGPDQACREVIGATMKPDQYAAITG